MENNKLYIVTVLMEFEGEDAETDTIPFATREAADAFMDRLVETKGGEYLVPPDDYDTEPGTNRTPSFAFVQYGNDWEFIACVSATLTIYDTNKKRKTGV